MSFGRSREEISVTFMSGPQDGKTLSFKQPPIGKERVITMGRRDSCDIHLPFDNQVSRVHARLGCYMNHVTQSESGDSIVLSFWLEDAESRNGVYIERDPDPIDNRTAIRPGSLFRVGRTWLRLDVPLSY